MAKKNTNPKKPKLKVDKSELVVKLECLQKKGQEMLEEAEIDIAEYDCWYSQVLTLLETSFDISENEYKTRFVSSVIATSFNQKSVPLEQIINQTRLKSDLYEELSSLLVIIDDISTQ